jgi:4-amino-4-deoxy-L-arabinose transferase-like glycosyltransferase
MEIDAAQYAALSMEMLQTGNFLEIFLRGENYLDKPPLTFWLTSASFALFGLNDIAYRIPNFLFSLLAFYSTFRFTKLYYQESVAWLAILILGSTQAFFLMNHDCRTDTFLTGAVAFSIWQLSAYLKSNKWQFLIGSGIGIGLSLLSKGPIGLVIPILAFGPHLVLQRKLKAIFDWKWVIVLFIVSIMLLPMCIGLYKQYGVYGLRFYFWIQSFGRITGESSWDNGTGYFFLLQNHLWSFAPWIIFFFPAIFLGLKRAFHNVLKPDATKEFVSLFGFILPFIAFSTSHYQLPHYIFVLYPMAAVFTAHYIIEIYQNWNKKVVLNVAQCILLAGYLALIIYLIFFCFHRFDITSIAYFLSLGFLYLVLNKVKSKGDRIIYFSIAMYTWLNLGLNGIVYPTLLTYQTGSDAAFAARRQNVPLGKIMCFITDGGFAMDFYLHRVTLKINDPAYLTQNNLSGNYVFTNEVGMKSLKNAGYSLDTIYHGKDYHVTTLTPQFLNPDTRYKTLENKYLVKVKK